MSEITCPHCSKAFKVDQAGYAAILSQVKNKEFDKEVHQRLELEKQKYSTELDLAKVTTEKESADALAKKERAIIELESKINSMELAKDLAVKDALEPVKEEITNLKSQVDLAESERIIKEKSLEDKYKTQIKDRDDEIQRLSNFKAKLSTKMVGETLELHCENEFDMLRSAAFPNAQFGKDNDASTGSKGDYIFRDMDENDIEFISIMFEMKNESDTTTTKKKNDDFLKELDKDRREKGCEYAVLVSLLESDSDLYNNGIVDKSHKYPKMYVIRPQFFIPMITLLRNAALKSLQVRNELELIKEQNIDITNFEDDLANVQAGFSKNYETAKKQFEDAIKSIDASISDLNKVKDRLLRSGNNYRLANDKLQGITIKKLTRNNPTMKSKFDKLE
ncbi:MAG: DUF2130 domain-containing protein [Euryarchaeota archaeon]|jgi:hypothetical protein|nr:DUF2130 domain-containing protein [Euryarchaeota archaeon]